MNITIGFKERLAKCWPIWLGASAVLLVPFITWGAVLWGRTFPVGDGGLWYVIASEISANHGLPPTSLKFNGNLLPLGYPPLSAYLLLGIQLISATDPLTLMVWIPYLLNILSVLFFYLFAKNYFAEPRLNKAGVLATLSYPFILHTCTNFFSGGALPRSLGLNFIFLSWWMLCRHRVSHGNSWTTIFLIGLFIAGAGLSHPTAALWSVAGVVLLSIFEARLSNRQLLASLAIAGLIMAPWMTFVLSANPIDIFLKAFSVGSGEMWGWRRFGQPESFLMPGGFVGSLGLLGILLLVRERMFAPSLLLLMGLILDRRGLFVLHGVSIAALGLGFCLASLSSYFSSERIFHNRLALWLFILAVGLPMMVNQASFVAERFKTSVDIIPIDTVEEYKSIIKVFEPGDKIALLAGRWERINGEWLSALSKLDIYPLPQAQEWTGRYASQIESFNKLAKCCSSSGWSCVQNTISKEELFARTFLIDMEFCSSVLLDYKGEIDLSSIRGFAIIKPAVVERGLQE